MKKEKNNNWVIMLLALIVVILAILCILFATGTITLNNKNKDNDLNDINLSLSMSNVNVSISSPNSHISVLGTMNLSYDNVKYEGIELSGYCLGTENEKYIMQGPCSGQVLLHSGENNLQFCESIPQKVQYSNGSTKEWSDIDWSNVKIKYCKIDKLNIITSNYEKTIEKDFNYEKEFN